MKVGFAKDGRITALDMFTVCNSGAYDAAGDGASAGRIVSLLYQPPAMRWRGVTVMTNTLPRSAQSAPGGMQAIAIMEPILAKAARKLGRGSGGHAPRNCPEGKAEYRPAACMASALTSQVASSSRRWTRAREQFKWKRAGGAQPKRIGTKVRGVGVS